MSNPGGKSLSKILLPILMILSFASVILLQMGFIFIMLAMLPSLIAYYVDRDEHLSMFKTILACNLAAIMPAIEPMLKSAIQLKPYDAVSLMTTPANWVVAFGGAAIGWCMIFLCRVIASFIMTVVYEYKIASLERLQKKLIEEWGEDLRQKNS